jgi:murein DD-endopeptidase MepM/ murein hydrolase activator NlpD
MFLKIAKPTLGAIAFFLMAGCRESREAKIPDTSPAPPALDFDTLATRIKVGESFNSIVRGLGLDEGESSLLLASIKEDFRFKLFAGQSYRVIFRGDALGKVVHSFALEDKYSDRQHILERSEEKSEQFHVTSLDYSMREIPVRTDTVAVTGMLTTSLYDAFLAKGETPALIQQVTKVFAWDIDFFKDPREGDEFSLLVEKKFGEDGSFRGYGPILSAKYVNRGHEFYGILYRGAYFDQTGRSLEKLLLKAPLNFARISSGFSTSRLHPILGVARPHWGIDYSAPKGTKILAAGDGTVEYAKWVNGYGKTIKVRHNGVYSTYYAHLNGYASGMRPGKRVRQKDVIGYLGMTGLATGPHLDYRVEKNGRFINPSGLKMDAKQGVTHAEWKDFCDQRDLLLARMFSPDYKRFASAY